MKRQVGPNVILIVFDTARADAFEPYGAAAGTTPSATQLASRGTAVSHAYSTCNWTLPSHVSMLTGLLPRTAGLSEFPGGDQVNCRVVMESHRDRILPEVLRKSGYSTIGASTNLWVSTRLGFATGFDRFHDLVGRRVAKMHEKGLRSRFEWYVQSVLARVDDGLGAVEDQMTQWLAAYDGTPFFWFVNLIECHSPYLPPRPYNDVGPIGRLKAAADARKYQTLAGVWRACAAADPPPDEALERMRHMYTRSVTFMDDWLGRLCERLDRQKILDETLVIVTSDHGENFGEDRYFGHSASLDDRLVRIPLVLAGPGVPAPGASGTNGVTSLASIPRIVADAAGLSDHPWTPDDIPSGPAVAQYDLGIDPNDPRTNILREWGASEERFRRFTEPATCATDGRHKLFVLGAEERLYDLAADPLETQGVRVDAALAGRPDVAALREAIEQARSSEWTPDLEALGRSAQDGADDTKELEDRMRLLGYL